MKRLTSEILEQLQYVKVHNRKIDLSHFPDFMVIGPQRTGTTWLYENLKQHPQIFMTEIKEPMFFNKLDKTWHERYVSSDLEWYMKFYDETPRQYLRKTRRAIRKYHEFYWPKIRGEASASYAAQHSYIIREIILLNPEIKAILIMRNPIERAWSHAKKDLGIDMGRETIEISVEELEKFIHNDYVLRCGQYSKIIANWQEFLRSDHLFIGTFDELQRSPDQLILRILSFLGVKSNAKYTKDFSHQVIGLRTDTTYVPPKFRDMLRGIYQEEMQVIIDTYHVDWAI